MPLDFIREVFDVMAATPQHTYQVLTKRSSGCADDRRQARLAAERLDGRLGRERQRYAFRVDHLREVPAAVRFLSCEPLLGPLDGSTSTASTG